MLKFRSPFNRPRFAANWFSRANSAMAMPVALPGYTPPFIEDRRFHLYSRFFALMLFVLSSPVLLLAILWVKIVSPGPAIFRQKRLGLNGTIFELFKLRTMVLNAEKDGAPVWAGVRDCRIIPGGRLLRKLRVDELPQLLNVFRGEMNIVGPRPERPEFHNDLCRKIVGFEQRLAVKPGLTGWAQINHGYADSVSASRVKHQHDMFFINNRSWKLEAQIVARTILVILTGFGAR